MSYRDELAAAQAQVVALRAEMAKQAAEFSARVWKEEVQAQAGQVHSAAESMKSCLEEAVKERKERVEKDLARGAKVFCNKCRWHRGVAVYDKTCQSENLKRTTYRWDREIAGGSPAARNNENNDCKEFVPWTFWNRVVSLPTVFFVLWVVGVGILVMLRISC